MHELTAVEQAAAIRAGELDPAALAAHYLERIRRLGPELGAFVTVTQPQPQPHPGEGPLAGVPTAVKDLTMTAGVPTTFGSAAFAGHVPQTDAHVVTAIRAAGMPMLGKTATSEFGCALYTEPGIGPPARNPWRPDLIPGGSSGGAAAAVAAGLVPVAHGSDGGGSLRIPAALCGIVGYKPSRGLVPLGPGGFAAFGLPVHGALARTVPDVAAFTAVLARSADTGGTAGEHYLPPVPAAALPTAVERPGPRLRIGRFTRPMLAEADVDPACLAAVDATADLLADLGHDIVDVTPPFDPDVLPNFGTVWAVLALWPLPPGTGGSLTPLVGWLRERALTTSAIDLTAALVGLQRAVETATRRLAGVDLTLCPTLAGTRAEVGSFAALGPAEDFAAQARFSPFCAPYNLMGAPAVSLPLGVTADGLPVGVMLAGRPGADGWLLATAAEVERARPWADVHPGIWRGGPHR